MMEESLKVKSFVHDYRVDVAGPRDSSGLTW